MPEQRMRDGQPARCPSGSIPVGRARRTPAPGPRPLAGRRATPGLDRQAFPRELVHERQDPQRLAVLAMILQEVVCPGVTGAFRRDEDGVALSTAATATPPRGRGPYTVPNRGSPAHLSDTWMGRDNDA